MEFIREAQSKGLVVFCWGDYNNDHENRMKLREQGIDGLIYDRWAIICLSVQFLQQQSLVGLRILIKCLLALHIDNILLNFSLVKTKLASHKGTAAKS